MYTTALLPTLFVVANGFTMPKALRYSTQLQMSDPWFPNSVTSNTVSLDSLTYGNSFIKLNFNYA